MTNFWQALDLVEEPKQVDIEFRLYYNDLGEVECYSMADLPGNYILIDAQTYAEGSPAVRVIDGKLVKPTQKIYQKIVPAELGETETLSTDVSIVGTGQKWTLKRYE